VAHFLITIMVEGTQEKEDNNSSHEPTTIATANLERGNPTSTDDASHNDSSGQNLSLRALPTEPVMGNAIENLAANLMSMAEAPPLSHCQSVKHNGQMKELYERVHQLEEQIEVLQWDVKSSITCQV
jgi:hypothetical protein